MAGQVRILALAGSTRRASYNKRMVAIAAKGAADAGALVDVIDLADYPMPVFDEDLEASQGPPESAVRLKTEFASHDAILIASPEYNSSVTAVLKNSIDWISRAAAGEPPLLAFAGKSALIMSASPGGLGGLRGLVHLRSILSNLGMLVLPEQLAISRAFEAFDGDQLKDPKQKAAVEALGAALARTAAKLKA